MVIKETIKKVLDLNESEASMLIYLYITRKERTPFSVSEISASYGKSKIRTGQVMKILFDKQLLTRVKIKNKDSRLFYYEYKTSSFPLVSIVEDGIDFMKIKFLDEYVKQYGYGSS